MKQKTSCLIEISHPPPTLSALHPKPATFTFYLTTYNLQLTTYHLQLTTYNLQLTTQLTTYHL